MKRTGQIKKSNNFVDAIYARTENLQENLSYLQAENASENGYFHMYRPTNLRFFNNLAVVVGTEDERVESLKAIADSVGVAMELAGHKPDMWFGRLERKKSKVPDFHAGGR